MYFRVRCCYEHWPMIKERNKHSGKYLLYPRLHTGYFTYIVSVHLQKIPQGSYNCALVTVWKIQRGRKMRKMWTCFKSWIFLQNTCLLVLAPAVPLVGMIFAQVLHNELHLITWLSTDSLGCPPRCTLTGWNSWISYSLLYLQNLEKFPAKGHCLSILFQVNQHVF